MVLYIAVRNMGIVVEVLVLEKKVDVIKVLHIDCTNVDYSSQEILFRNRIG